MPYYMMVVVDTGKRLQGQLVSSIREVRRLSEAGGVLDWFGFDDLKKKDLIVLGRILRCPTCRKLLSAMLAESWNYGAATVEKPLKKKRRKR